MGLKRIQIWLIPTFYLCILPIFFPFIFVFGLIKKAVKVKKRECFLNWNDLEDKSKRNPCFKGAL